VDGFGGIGGVGGAGGVGEAAGLGGIGGGVGNFGGCEKPPPGGAPDPEFTLKSSPSIPVNYSNRVLRCLCITLFGINRNQIKF